MYGMPNQNPNYPAPKSVDVDPVAEFLAKGGQITKVEEGKRAMSERDVFAKASGNDKMQSEYTDKRMREAENQYALEANHAFYSQ